MADMKEIVSRLNALTQENRVPWKSTSDRSAFVAVYGDLSVRISSRGDEPLSAIGLGVYDGQGNLIDSTILDGAFSVGTAARDLQQLYLSAKRTALGVDKRLAKLMERMNAAPPVSSE